MTKPISMVNVDKNILEEVTSKACDKEYLIARYLRLPYDELPEELWENVKGKNDKYLSKSI
ncbi:hypothetical protein DIC82_08645 [Clostridium beijerinckii]|nr:hypothetical protein DIC82_08645 [Clostridium beijerinckii]